MAIYKLRLFGDSGTVVAVQRVSEETDKEALAIIRDMFGEASGVCFELWHGERLIKGVAPTMRKEKPRR